MAARAGTVFQALAVAAAASLGACASTPPPLSQAQQPPKQDGGFLGLFGGGGEQQQVAPQIGVNTFLWRATIDTLSFMPMSKADPITGQIATEWWADPEMPSEWMKVEVDILDTRLRADGLSVRVFRRTGATAETAVPATIDRDTGPQLENAILTRARVLRLQTVD